MLVALRDDFSYLGSFMVVAFVCGFRRVVVVVMVCGLWRLSVVVW